MKIAQRITGHIALMTISGKLMDNPDTCGLYDHIRYFVDHDVYQVIIDLKEVKWINSNGVGALMGCLSFLEGHNCELKLVHMSHKIRDVLAMMDILHYFQAFNSVNSAILAGKH